MISENAYFICPDEAGIFVGLVTPEEVVGNN